MADKVRKMADASEQLVFIVGVVFLIIGFVYLANSPLKGSKESMGYMNAVSEVKNILVDAGNKGIDEPGKIITLKDKHIVSQIFMGFGWFLASCVIFFFGIFYYSVVNTNVLIGLSFSFGLIFAVLKLIPRITIDLKWPKRIVWAIAVFFVIFAVGDIVFTRLSLDGPKNVIEQRQ